MPSRIMQKKITSFIVELLEKKQGIPACQNIADYRFIDAGHVDSLGLMKFILQIEQEYNVELSDTDIASEMFRSVGGLSDLLAKKIAYRANKTDSHNPPE